MVKENYNQQINNILGSLTTVAGLSLMEELVRGTNTKGDTTDDTTSYAQGLAITAITFAGIKLLNEIRVLLTNIYEDYHQTPVVDAQQQESLALLETGMNNLSEVLQATKGHIVQLQLEKDKLEEENERLLKQVGELIDTVSAPILEVPVLLINTIQLREWA